MRDGLSCRYDFINGIDYGTRKVNYLRYEEEGGAYPFDFLTNPPLSHHNALATAFYGRRRWKIENQGFNAQKNHGFALGHLFSRNYQAMKNHYYLIQIGHMIAQIIDAWKSLWKDIRQSKEQKHRRILESWKISSLVSAGIFNCLFSFDENYAMIWKNCVMGGYAYEEMAWHMAVVPADVVPDGLRRGAARIGRRPHGIA